MELGTALGGDDGGIDRREALTQPGEAFEQPLQRDPRVLGLAFGLAEAGAQEDPGQGARAHAKAGRHRRVVAVLW